MTRNHFRPVILALMVVALAYACNDATDDPEISDNLVSVAGFNASSACVDYDGEPVEVPFVDVEKANSMYQFTRADFRKDTSPNAEETGKKPRKSRKSGARNR